MNYRIIILTIIISLNLLTGCKNEKPTSFIYSNIKHVNSKIKKINHDIKKINAQIKIIKNKLKNVNFHTNKIYNNNL